MHTTLALCWLAALVAGPVHATERSNDPTAHPNAARAAHTSVRGANDRMIHIVREAIKRSPTFAALVDSLNRTDVIVHVEELMKLPIGIDGRLTFATTAGGKRYLRVQVRQMMSPNDLIATVGHELQHALEVAAHTDVRDASMFASLYERIGERIGRGHFDTAAAREAGRRVRNELAN